MRTAGLVLVLLLANSVWAASSESTEMSSVPVFRVETGEVRVTFTAYGDRNQRITNLSANDFKVLRDGVEVPSITAFENASDTPLSLVLMCDISESMKPALPLEASLKAYLAQSELVETDEVSMVDFGAYVQEKNSRKVIRRLTSLYDSLIDQIRAQTNDFMRKSVVLVTDGNDNYSLHSMRDVIDAAQRRNMPFYTIAVQAKKITNKQSVLRQMAEQTGGRFFVVSTQQQMFTAMKQIEKELRSSFVVTFRADPRSKGVHKLTMQAHGKNLRFVHRSVYFQQEEKDLPPVQNIWPELASH
ncbi:MAG TPA: VWA domain-containing protein [Terriglobales bacterium]|nr:VWA domain-containing protein [Terriglobales bacterium]